VADALRTAVYYTEIDLNPAKAMKAYREVLWPDPCHFHIGDVGEDEGTTNN
jgi:hypothetical protein